MITRRRAFLSFHVGTDDLAAAEFVESLHREGVSITVDDRSASKRQPEDDWQKLVYGRIARCNLMVVLVGKDAGSSNAMAQEMKQAKSANVPYFGVRLEGATDEDCTQLGLPASRVIAVDWPRISSAIEQLMAEGKNHIFA